MNIKKYFLYRFLNDLMPIYPLYLIMFERNGLSVARISLLLAIWSVPSVLFEIPTGILADRWSRKNLIVTGTMLKALCYLTWMLPYGFYAYAAGFVFWGTGGALISGAEEALLYDSLKLQGKEESFDLVLGRGHFLTGIGNILAAVSGGFIGAKFGYQAALALSAGIGAITTGITLTMKEVNLYKEELTVNRDLGKTDTLKAALVLLLKNKELLLFSLLALLVITTAGVLDEYDQLIAKGFGLSVGAIGIWSAIRFILMAAGSYGARGIRIAAEKITGQKNRLYCVCLICVMAAVLLIAAGAVRQLGIMVLYGLYYLLMSAGEVLQEDFVQQKIDGEGRSTVHSLLSLSRNLYGIMFYGLFGLIVSRSDLFRGLVWCGAYIAVCTVILGTVGSLYRHQR